MTLSDEIREYEWDSEDQKEGFLALLDYLNRHGGLPETMDLTAVFFIQKHIDALTTLTESFGDQVTRLQNDIRSNQDEVASLRREIDALSQAAKSNSMAIELVLRKTK